jgi:hypothetical protein
VTSWLDEEYFRNVEGNIILSLEQEISGKTSVSVNPEQENKPDMVASAEKEIISKIEPLSDDFPLSVLKEHHSGPFLNE